LFECLLTSITLAFAGKRVALVLRARGVTATGFVRLNVEATAEVRRSSTLWWLAFRVYTVCGKNMAARRCSACMLARLRKLTGGGCRVVHVCAAPSDLYPTLDLKSSKRTR